MSSGAAKRRRRQARQARAPLGKRLTVEDVRRAYKSLAAKHLIEPVEGSIDDSDGPRSIIVNTPARALELAKADPNIYKTPAGNMISLEGADGDIHWMTPAEAEHWQINAEEVDRRNPGGTKA